MILEPAEPRGKCMRENGVGHCTFPALGRDPEWCHDRKDKAARRNTHDQAPQRSQPSV